MCADYLASWLLLGGRSIDSIDLHAVSYILIVLTIVVAPPCSGTLAGPEHCCLV